MNIVIFNGRLTKDLEYFSYGNEGKQMAKTSIAVSTGVDNKANFFNIIAFGKTAENMGKFGAKKGSKVTVYCKANQNDYTDKNGIKHHNVNFTVLEFSVEDSREKSNDGAMSGNENDFLKVPEGSDEGGYPFEF